MEAKGLVEASYIEELKESAKAGRQLATQVVMLVKRQAEFEEEIATLKERIKELEFDAGK